MSYITLNGAKKLRCQLNELLTKRALSIANVAEARSQGDLSENEGYKSSKEDHRILEKNINKIKQALESMKIIDPRILKNTGIITFGSTVFLKKEHEDKILQYTIMNNIEASFFENALDYKSPLAKKLIGNKVGNVVNVVTPYSSCSYLIVQINYEM